MLNGIDVCFKHSLKYNRTLIIDSRQISWFKDDIHRYIDFVHPLIYKNDIDKILTELEPLSIFPIQLKGQLKKFTIYFKNQTFMIKGDIPTSIDLSIDYMEDVIVYSNCGGHIPTEIYKYIKFKSIIKNVYYNRLSKLPKFISIHIRHTDKKCNIIEFTKKYENLLLNNQFFLATDNYNILKSYKEKFKDTIFHFSNIPLNEEGKNIHYYHTNIDHQSFIIDCIVDLLLLASGEKYYFSTHDSGYSNFANFLYHNKPILKYMLN